MNKTNINPGIFQQLFESASNAGAKGQAQYFTPEAWAKVLSLPLGRPRPVVVDLCCGNGQLLRGASHHSKLLGCDIDAINPDFLQADITKFYPLLRRVNFQADCVVLNPPWDMHWHRENLFQLFDSSCPAVVVAFDETESRTGADTIDSTIASLCMGIDLLSVYGEGFLVGNESTLQRLLFSTEAPYSALAEHIWAHLIIDGNICNPSTLNPPPSTGFQTGIVYFARDHTFGRLSDDAEQHVANLKEAEQACRILSSNRLYLRKGAKVYDGVDTENTVAKWNAAVEEWNRLNNPSLIEIPYNLWLENGRIRTYLSLFDVESDRYKNQAAKLFELNGKQPMQLVVQVAHRRALEAAVNGKPGEPSPWRVDPKLQQAVVDAIAEYNRVRAPLYPLSDIMRLGYLDEHDLIECKKDLPGGLGDICFRAGEHYSLRSMTTQVNRTGQKLNLHGKMDDMEWNGSELGFFIRDASGMERLFMEGRLRDPSIKVSISLPAGTREAVEKVGADSSQVCAIDFTLQELVEHFIIPEVPDVATLDPEGYQCNLQLLEEIEALCQ